MAAFNHTFYEATDMLPGEEHANGRLWMVLCPALAFAPVIVASVIGYMSGCICKPAKSTFVWI